MAARRTLSRRRWLLGTIAAGAVAPLSACNRNSNPSTNGPAGGGMPPPKEVPDVSYKLGAYLPPLDEGRVRIPAPDPKEWHVAPRTKYYVCQFTRSTNARVPLPRIRVTVTPASEMLGKSWSTVDAKDARKFAQRVADVVPQPSLKERVIPMIIGKHACARYVSAAKFRMRTESGAVREVMGEKQVVVLLHGGRVYSVELHVHPGRILDYRDAAYAVVAGIQFVDDDETGSAEETGSDKGQQQSDK